MAALTGQTVQASYKDVLQVSNSNAGIDATLRAVSDGEGTASPLELSSAAVNISSGFQLGGTAAQAGALLKHEVGGIEANISAIADGGILVGTGTGTMAIRAAALTGGAAGFLKHEIGGLEFDVSAITTDQFLAGTSAGVIGIRTAAQVRTSLGLVIGTDVQAFDADTTKNDVANVFTQTQTVRSTDAGATEGPAWDLHRDSATPAANDLIGAARFKGEDDAGNETTYGKIVGIITDPADLSEAGHLRVDSMIAGTLTSGFHIGASIFAEGNTDPGAGKIDADDLLISGTSLPIQKRAVSSDLAITLSGVATFAHGLGVVPKIAQVWLINSTAELNYSVGDEILPIVAGSTNAGIVMERNATNLIARFGPAILVLNKTTHAVALITAANWKARIECYA